MWFDDVIKPGRDGWNKVVFTIEQYQEIQGIYSLSNTNILKLMYYVYQTSIIIALNMLLFSFFSD